MPQIPKHIPIQMLFIVYAILKCPIPSMISYSSSTLYICNLKSSTHSPPHLLHHHHLCFNFRGCTFRSFGRSLPFRYASQIHLKLHTAVKSLFHFFHCP